MIITVASTKGGVGKSTLVVNLAISFSEMGKKVFVIDSDKQGTALTFGEIRSDFASDKPAFKVASAQGEALQQIAESQSEKGGIVLIDSAGVDDKGTRTALAISDYILTASAPTPADLWALSRLQKLIDKLGQAKGSPVKWMLALNKVHPNTKDLDFVSEYLDNAEIYPTTLLNTIIRNRASFADSFSYGIGVSEYSDEKAKKEIEELSKEILNRINHG